MVSFKRFNTHKDRGLAAEKDVQSFLDQWHQHPQREYNRLVDAKAAGRIIKAAAADFEFYCIDDYGDRHFGLIEVKQTEHDYRLARDKLPQLPRMRKRANCGGLCVVVVYHSEIKKWRAMTTNWLTNNGDKGSWNLTNLPTFDTVSEALKSVPKKVFP